MTPLLPTPDYYLHNLITMTSSESKMLWRELSKSTLIVMRLLWRTLMNYNNSLLTMYALNAEGVEMKQRTLCHLVNDAIRKKVVKIGLTG